LNGICLFSDVSNHQLLYADRISCFMNTA
jgi:hypothetical protein